jgi:coproporphyrinogen III oxidase-like Fe-S oxidoreductase
MEGPCYLRRENTHDRKAYEERLSQGLLPAGEDHLIGREEAMFEAMMLGLRMVDGVGKKDFARRFGVPLEQAYGREAEELIREGLGQWKERKAGPAGDAQKAFALTPKGMLLQNRALLRLMRDERSCQKIPRKNP